MKIIAIEKENPAATPEDFKKFGRAEALAAYRLQQAGFIRELYFKADENMAVLFLEAESVAITRSKLDQLPFVKNGLITFDLLPLRPYPGFERLFARKDFPSSR